MVDILDGTYLVFFRGALSEKMIFGKIGSSRAQLAGRGAAVITVITADSLGNSAGFGLSGTRGIVGVEVVAATEISAPSSPGGSCTKRGIDNDEAFRDSGLDGPSAVTTGSAVVWVVVTAGTLDTAGATVELSLLANLYKMRSVQWQQHLKLILQWVHNLAAKRSELVLCA